MDNLQSQLVNRGNNLASVAIAALSGIAFLPETFIESEGPYKLDDALLFILGIIAVVWYKRAENRFKRSLVPTIILSLALLTKIMAIAIEHTDKNDVGDDFGALILFISATIFSLWLYNKSKVSTKK